MVDERAARIAGFIKPWRVKPGTTVDLSEDFGPRCEGGFLKKMDGVELLKTGIADPYAAAHPDTAESGGPK